MDIDQKFYPLPLITIPDIAIPKPVIPEVIHLCFRVVYFCADLFRCLSFT